MKTPDENNTAEGRSDSNAGLGGAMTSRIWIDAREALDDEHLLWFLGELGFTVNRFFPVRCNKHIPHNEVQNSCSFEQDVPERIEFPDDSRVWVHNHQSLPKVECLPSDERVVHLFQWLRSGSQASHGNNTCTGVSCDAPVIIGNETPNVKLSSRPTLNEETKR